MGTRMSVSLAISIDINLTGRWRHVIHYETNRSRRWWGFDVLLQEALVKRLGPNAHAFTMEITPLAPPSVQLVPAKEYNGAPIGTSYDVRAYVGE